MNPLQNTKTFGMLEPISVNGTAATVTPVDTRGAKFARVIFFFGAIGAGDLEGVSVTEGDTTGGSFTAISSASFTVTQTDDGKIFICDVDLTKNRKRYLKPVVDPAAVATLASVICILDKVENGPTSASDAGGGCSGGTGQTALGGWVTV